MVRTNIVNVLRNTILIQLNKLVGVPDGREVFQELFARDDYRRPVVVGVERVGGAVAQVGVEEQVDVVVRIV